MNIALKILEVFEQAASATVCVMAIWVAITKRKQIAGIYRAISGFTNQMSYVDLRVKIAKLEDLDFKGQREDIMIILSEIQGQMTGNPFLRSMAESQFKRIEGITKGQEKLTARSKANLVGELKEVLRLIPAEPFRDGSKSNE